MALIECPECGAHVSESAPGCPHCAFPLTSKPARGSLEVESALTVTRQIVGRLILGGAFMWSGVVWEAPPVIIGALVLFGSALPIWVRARKAERLGETQSSRVGERVTRRIGELEDRLSDVEQLTGQIPDLDERLDFAERLLTEERNRLEGGARSAPLLRQPPEVS